MADAALLYRIPGASWRLVFPAEATQFLLSHAQRWCWSREAAGQLYSADPGHSNVLVSEATKLPSRVASRTGLRLDLPAVTNEREAFFQRGLHCVGFWHTHPEPTPSPSRDDVAMAADHAHAGKATFAGLVFAIVGTAPAPQGLGVWVHDGTTLWKALAEPQLATASNPMQLS